MKLKNKINQENDKKNKKNSNTKNYGSNLLDKKTILIL
jgi:hypothetical protein